jgi:hypothetical protein
VNVRISTFGPTARKVAYVDVPESTRTLAPPVTRQALLAAGLAAGSVALLRLVIPVGIDSAAHAYQTLLWLHSGFHFWDNYWYDGHYSFVDYSLLYYPIAGVIGEVATVLVSVSVSGFLFARLVCGRFGVSSAWPIRVFAISLAVVVWLSGEYPFALGLALGLAALSLRRSRLPLASLAALGTLLASPLAFLLLLVGLGGLAFGNLRRLPRIDLLMGLAVCVLVALGLQLAFPITGTFHYNFWALFQVLAMSAVAGLCSIGLRGVASIRGLFAAMAVLAIAAYVIPSPLGGNATRLVDYVGAPLIWILLTRQRQERRLWMPLVAVVGAIVLGGQLAPTIVSAALALGSRSDNPAFWSGAIRFLHHNANPNFRAEAVDTADHWDAYYLPASGIPIVRGWFRQADFPDNTVLYQDAVSATRYRAWLRRNGVRYVVLPHDTLDYSAVAEARLLQSGESGLRIGYQDPFVTIYALPHPTPLLVGPLHRRATVLNFGHTSVVLWVSGAGRYSLAVSYTPYWRIRAPGRACVTPGWHSLTTLVASARGTISMHFHPTLRWPLGDATSDCGSPVPGWPLAAR